MRGLFLLCPWIKSNKSHSLSGHSPVAKSPNVFSHKDVFLSANNDQLTCFIHSNIAFESLSVKALHSPPSPGRPLAWRLWWVSYIPSISSIWLSLLSHSLGCLARNKMRGKEKIEGQEKGSLWTADAIHHLGRVEYHC